MCFRVPVVEDLDLLESLDFTPAGRSDVEVPVDDRAVTILRIVLHHDEHRIVTLVLEIRHSWTAGVCGSWKRFIGLSGDPMNRYLLSAGTNAVV